MFNASDHPILDRLQAVARGELSPEESARVVTEGLDHTNVRVREAAAATAWLLWDDEDVVRRLTWIAASDEVASVRAGCVYALQRLMREGVAVGLDLDETESDPVADPEAGEDVLRQLFIIAWDVLSDRVRDEDEDLAVRCRAIEGLGYIPDDVGINDMITQFAGMTDPAARASAASAMGISGDDRWAGAVGRLLVDPAPRVRIEAMRAAAWLQIDEARDLLEERCIDNDPDTAIAAADALADLLPLEEAYSRLRELAPRVAPAAAERFRELLEEITYDLLVPEEEYGDNGHDSADKLL